MKTMLCVWLCASAAFLGSCGEKGNNANTNGGGAANGSATENGNTEPEPKGDTQETSEGAMNLFMEALREADYLTATELAAESSPGMKELADATEVMETARTMSEKPDGKAAAQMIITKLTAPFVGAEVISLGEEGDAARFNVKLAGEDNTAQLEAVRKGGVWYIVVPEDFIMGSIGGLGG